MFKSIIYTAVACVAIGSVEAALDPSALATVPADFVAALKPCIGQPELQYLQCSSKATIAFLSGLATTLKPMQSDALNADIASVIGVAQAGATKCASSKTAAALSTCVKAGIKTAEGKMSGNALAMLKVLDGFSTAIAACAKGAVAAQSGCTTKAIGAAFNKLTKVLLAAQ